MNLLRPDELQFPGDLGERFHPGGEEPCLLLDLRKFQGKAEDLAAAIAELPCPVIAVGEEDPSDELHRAVDCLVPETAALDALVAGIRRAPIAAMTLVQLSRAIERLPLMAALDMESLAFATLQNGPEYRAWLAERHGAEPVAGIDEGPAVELERSDSELLLTLNRPSRRNAISLEMRDALVEALQLAVMDESIARVVLRANGKCFSIGGDLDEFGHVPDSATGHLVRSLRLPGRWLARCADRVEVRVHGACIGAGVELPAFAGMVIADARTHFQLPELGMGLIPGAGGCVSIARRIGRWRFNWLALSGRRITARTALEWGLVDRIE